MIVRGIATTRSAIRMWRDFSMSSRGGQNSNGAQSAGLGSYQTKSTSEFHKNSVPQLGHHPHQPQSLLMVNGGGSGPRSSYSLPHPAHLQSNTRWQGMHHDQPMKPQPPGMMGPQRSSLMHSPSYPHIPSAGDPHHSNGDHRGGRPRPVSMYDMPQSAGGTERSSGFSFIPSLLLPNKSKSSSASSAPLMAYGYNGASAPASLQQHHYHHPQQHQQQPKKGQIMRQGPGELVRPTEAGGECGVFQFE